jgi:hypothetical protein
MPGTDTSMLILIDMGAGITANFIATRSFDGVNPNDITNCATWGAASAGVRRMGVATYLIGVAFGLGAIIEVVRFRTIRIREVPPAHDRNDH